MNRARAARRPETASRHGWTLVSDPVRLREARGKLMTIARTAGFSPDATHDLGVAFSEACANVHRHAYGGRRDGRVEVRVEIEPDRIVVALDHDGRRFEADRYAPPDLAQAAEGGYGLYLIERLVDEVSYEDAARGGRVVLVKRKGVAMSGMRSQGYEDRRDGTTPDLAELCRIHEIGLDLIGRSHDVDDLLDRILDEYEARLQDLPADALDARADAPKPDSVRKLRALVMFAAQATALKEKAVAAGELRRRAAMLEESNAKLAAALEEAERMRAHLDGVLAALSSGVMILDAGSLIRANDAARVLAGAGDDAALGRLIAHGVPSGGEAEIDLPADGGGRRTLLVARRPMAGPGAGEVVMVTDVTLRNRAVEERVRLEKLAEVLKTLSVLSHKINNPLTALLGRAQILQAHRSGDPAVAKAAAVIEEASQRIAELIRELANVVREGRHDALDDLLDMSVARGERS